MIVKFIASGSSVHIMAIFFSIAFQEYAHLSHIYLTSLLVSVCMAPPVSTTYVYVQFIAAFAKHMLDDNYYCSSSLRLSSSLLSYCVHECVLCVHMCVCVCANSTYVCLHVCIHKSFFSEKIQIAHRSFCQKIQLHLKFMGISKQTHFESLEHEN